MISTEIHPAESAEFLSRLHDGELEPAEAAAFESHRAECADCRASVAAFERALSAYREAPVPPVSSDLSARILRKIRATTPSRRPFGVTFGIDVRWAGVLAAALLVLIIGAPVFSRHPFARAPEAVPPRPAAPAPEAISAYMVDAAEAPRAADEVAPAAPPAAELRAAPKVAPAPPVPPPRVAESRREESRQEPAFAAPPPLAARREDAAGARPDASGNAAPAVPEADKDSRAAGRLAKENAPSLRAPRPSVSAESPGGEAGQAGALEAPLEVRLTIRAIDGEGTAPDVVRTPSDERLAPLRGREFVLIVETGGRVRSVEARPERKAKDEASAATGLSSTEDPGAVLRELVFQAGDRSRRLTVLVQ